MTEEVLPQTPVPVYDKDAIMRKPVPQDSTEERYPRGKVYDEESAIHSVRRTRAPIEEIQAATPTQSWQPQECTERNRQNETKRAQYDLYPKA